MPLETAAFFVFGLLRIQHPHPVRTSGLRHGHGRQPAIGSLRRPRSAILSAASLVYFLIPHDGDNMADDSSRKDLWDRLTALATILVPAAIALAGHFIGQGLKEAELRGQERQAQQASAIAEANTKIAQAGLINTLMKSLTSPNPQERKLAVQAVLIALPDQGPLLARTIAQTDEDEAVQVAARSSLKQRADTLIRQLFADDAATRIAAAGELVQGWRSEGNAVGALLDAAFQNSDNDNGIYNVAVVLGECSPAALAAHRAEVVKFIDLAQAKGAKTAAKTAILSRRLQEAGPG